MTPTPPAPAEHTQATMHVLAERVTTGQVFTGTAGVSVLPHAACCILLLSLID